MSRVATKLIPAAALEVLAAGEVRDGVFFLPPGQLDRKPKNDPMLPAQDAPHGHCLECESVHRLDIGCPHSAWLPRWLVVILIVALLVIGVALWCHGVER